MEHNQVDFLSSPALFQEKEGRYLEVRRREGRVLSDEVVKKLPGMLPSNPYTREWKFRARSLNRLKKHLLKDTQLQILDLGCGNGWMANRLAENPHWKIWAVDLNQEELEQGARLFGRQNLKFVYADVLQGVLPENQFDVIVLAAAIQYFPDLEALLVVLRKLLTTKGEIHIIDAPFYKKKAEKAAAGQRSLAYYSKVGVPEMAQFYHHHLLAEAENLGAENLNGALKIKILQKLQWLAPFPWLCFNGSMAFRPSGKGAFTPLKPSSAP